MHWTQSVARSELHSQIVKTLVLVLGARVAPYPALIRTIKSTWASSPVAGAEVLFYYGGEELAEDGNELVLPVSDGALSIGRKTIACFGHVLEHHEFDLIFRTNCSSYVDLPNLSAYATRHARPSGFYSGFIGYRGELAFASGSGYFLSRDLAALAVSERERWDHVLPDDQALAAVLAQHGVQPEPAPRQNFDRLRRVRDVDTSLYHFRCRTYTRRRVEDERIMREVHRVFCRARGARLSDGPLRWIRRMLPIL